MSFRKEKKEGEKIYKKVPTVDIPKIDPATFEKQIPNRQWCDMCGGLCRIIFWVPDNMWLESIPKHHWTSRVCIECFMQRADEKFLPWDKHLKIMGMSSFYTQRIVQTSISDKSLKDGEEF